MSKVLDYTMSEDRKVVRFKREKQDEGSGDTFLRLHMEHPALEAHEVSQSSVKPPPVSSQPPLDPLPAPHHPTTPIRIL